MNAVALTLEDRLSFWKEALAGAPVKLELPTDKPRPATQSPFRARASFAVSGPVFERLKAIGAAEQAGPFVILGAAFLVLLNRYTAQDDILLAAPLGPADGEDRGTRTVVIRARFTDALLFRSLLQQVRDWTLDAEEHSEISFEELVAELAPRPDPSHAPLCQVGFVLEQAENGVGAAAVARREAAHRAADQATALCDLTLFFAEGLSGLEASIAYSPDLFDADTIRRMCGHYGALLEAVAQDPQQPVKTLSMLTARERAQLLDEWNDTAAAFPSTCAHQLFEQQVTQHPDTVALLFEGQSSSYRELNERANQIAHLLRKKGVGPDVLVGVCLERCPQMVAALLGVWKAGGAYVPLDPAHPKDRLAYTLTDAAAKVLITDDAHRPLFPSEVDAVCVDSDAAVIAAESTSDLGATQTPADLAYVMYTSGSTGQPKGVMVLQRGLVNYLCWAIKTYRADAGGAVPVHSSIGFDLTVTALFVPLAGGISIEILREDVAGQKLVAAMREGRDRSLVKITPAHLALLSDQLGANGVPDRTRLFVIGGENLTAESLSLWRDHAPRTRLINEYGPTETVVGCCVHEVAAGDPRSGSVIIGRPIANTRLYVLDRHLNPLPVGAVGELYIGGAGVARGYLNRPDLTEERFLPDPFSTERQARMYKSGDLARYRPDGALEYLGRVDNQVKVRGYRIELGEIEATLADHPAVKACAVLAREDTPGNKHLVGYVVALADGPDVHNPPAVEDLRQFLRGRLPEYMVPGQFVFLDAMPLTGNGKVDRKALPVPSPERATPAARVAPRNEIEDKLSAIWQEMLALQNIGVDDNFFELGGHSLLAIKVVTRIRKVLDVDLPPQAVIDDPTIAALARTVSALLGPVAEEPATTVVAARHARRGPCFFGEPPLFGVYHPPTSGPRRDTALLVCPSIGHEHTRGHHAIQILCDAAARAGFAALRFDYTGVGDSAGTLSDASPDGWCADIQRAIEELIARSGARAVHLVGLRLGAVLAVAALQRGGPAFYRKIQSVCLWDPLPSGEAFFRQARTFQDRFLRDRGRFSAKTIRRRPPRGAGDYLVGYAFPDAVTRSIGQLGLPGAEDWPPVTMRAVLSEGSPVWDGLAARLVSAGRAISSEVVKGAPGIWGDYVQHEKTLRAGPVTARIVDQLAEDDR
ncbi:MAG TPA: amino acid adenylation domain-containing protein [Polyangia bacterium]|nr:amino acid adenylation domain-containing protein [Polyangia bacterium]